MNTSVKELRIKTKDILRRVTGGEEVIITIRGIPSAKISPLNFSNNLTKIKTNKLFGIWKDNDRVKDVCSYVRNLRKGRFNANN